MTWRKEVAPAIRKIACGLIQWQVSTLSVIDYLRQQAETFRALAESQTDPAIRDELLGLAEECERVAKEMADRMNGNET